jgi:hypothetical protein
MFGVSAAYQALSLRFESHRFLAYQALRFLSHQRMLPFVSSQRFGFVIKPSLCFENYRSASETIALSGKPRTQKPFRAEPRTFSTPSCDIQPCPRNSNQQS